MELGEAGAGSEGNRRARKGRGEEEREARLLLAGTHRLNQGKILLMPRISSSLNREFYNLVDGKSKDLWSR